MIRTPNPVRSEALRFLVLTASGHEISLRFLTSAVLNTRPGLCTLLSRLWCLPGLERSQTIILLKYPLARVLRGSGGCRAVWDCGLGGQKADKATLCAPPTERQSCTTAPISTT
jgi:hypothetical protein